MSLLEVSRRQTKRCDLPQKVCYTVFVNTSNPSAPVVEGDPYAQVKIIGTANEQQFYLFVRGNYQNFLELPLSETLQTYTPIVNFTGTIAAAIPFQTTDAGYVASMNVDPNDVTVPNEYTVFSFACISASNFESFIPSLGIYINIEISWYPAQSAIVDNT